MPQDLYVTNVLLGVIAGAQTILLLGLVVGLIYMRRALTQVQTTVRDLEREHVAPLRTQAERILTDVSRVSARVEAQAARLDGSLSGSLDAAERQVQRVKSAVDAVTRETSAVANGVRAAVSAVTGRALRNHNPTAVGRLPAAVSEEDIRNATAL